MTAERRSAGELALLFEISQVLDSSLDLGAVLEPVLDALVRTLQVTVAALTLLNRSTGEIAIEAARGLSPGQRRKGRYRVGEGVIGRVIETGESAVIPRISEEPRFLNRTGAHAGESKDDSFICVPIMIGREVIGALAVDLPGAPPDRLREDARILAVVASLVARAVKLRQSAQEERDRLLEEHRRLEGELKDRYRPGTMIGNSKAMRDVYALMAQVAGSDTTVLLRGESGTGKELVAHALHLASPRAVKPFVKVNCAALPEGTIESELFGHEKGAFTDATAARKGRFEMADGGTLFLDEIGDLSRPLQAKLLRVLQEREIERVGGSRTIPVDVRIIAATNRDLEALLAREHFRQDLYYRLNVFPIHIPPLRERRTDILLLADFFAERYSGKSHKNVRRISTPAIDMLMAWSWPGNVRELENCIERAVLLSTDDVIHGHHLPPALQIGTPPDRGRHTTLEAALERVEREMLVEALKSARGTMATAAAALGVTERVMGLRVRKYGIDVRRFRNRETRP